MRDNPAIDLIKPNLVPVFDRMGFLAPANDVRVRLENAHHLVLGWHTLAFQDPPFGLIHHLLGQRNEGRQRSFQALGCFFNLVFKLCLVWTARWIVFSVMSNNS